MRPQVQPGKATGGSLEGVALEMRRVYLLGEGGTLWEQDRRVSKKRESDQ